MSGKADFEFRLMSLMLWPVLWFFLTGLGGALYTKNEQGNTFFQQKQFDNAEKAYLSATRESPQSPQLHYNIGNVLFMQQKYDKALEEYAQALTSDDKALRARVYYNQGNALFKGVDLQTVKSQEDVQKAMDAYQKSIDSFTETLKLKPDDEDAKFNIEYIRRMLKELAQKAQNQQNQQQQQNGQQNKDQQQQSSGNQNQDQQKQDQQQAQKDQQDKKDQKDQKDQKEQQQAQAEQKDQQNPEQKEPQPQDGENAEKREMTPEEARRILDSVKEDEKDNNQRLVQVPDRNYSGVDW
jgi:Ca-activated chloride channel homolog